MTNPERKSNPEIKIGEMPKPRYMREAYNTAADSDGTSIRWIGMEAYAPDGQIKEFLWWRNFKAGDLSNEQVRHDTAAFVARLKLEMKADVAIGLPIDLFGSNAKTGSVKVIGETEVYGAYIESEKRGMFNFMAMMNGVKTEAQLREQSPVKFEEIFQKAKAVLPKSNGSEPSENQSDSEQSLDKRIEFLTGDITNIEADAIVCPSLPDLDVLYTGVAGAIMRKGGERIFEEALALGKKAKEENTENEYPVPLYSAHITNGGDLPKAKYVIHSVAVDYTEKGLDCNPEVIFKSAWNVLEVADKNKLKSVAFPALGAGLYQVPLDQSFGAIAQATDRYLKEHSNTTLKNIRLVSFDTRLPKPTLVEELVVDGWVRSMRARKN